MNRKYGCSLNSVMLPSVPELLGLTSGELKPASTPSAEPSCCEEYFIGESNLEQARLTQIHLTLMEIQLGLRMKNLHLETMKAYILEVMEDTFEISQIPPDVYDDVSFLKSLSEQELQEELAHRDKEVDEYLRCCRAKKNDHQTKPIADTNRCEVSNLKPANPLRWIFHYKFPVSKKIAGSYRPLLQLMVCNSVQRFLHVVGDSCLHGLQEFRALWLLAQGCRKNRPSIEKIM